MLRFLDKSKLASVLFPIAVALALPAGVAAEQPLRRLEGNLHPVLADAPLFEPSDVAAGRFSLRAAGRRDLRLAPKWLRLRTDGGRLVARATRASVDADEALDVLCEALPEAMGSACAPAPRARPSRIASLPGFRGLFGLEDGSLFYFATTDEQEALLGCGIYYGTDCDADGIDLLQAEASVFMQSFVGTAMTNPLIGYDYMDSTQPAPNAVLPGDRGEGDPGYNPLVDGCVRPGPFGCNAGDFGRVGDARELRIPAVFTGAGGQVFRSEMAAASFNIQLGLAALSSSPDTNGDIRPSPPVQPNEFAVTDPFNTEPRQCSWAQPQFCGSQQALYDPFTERWAPRLPGDPREELDPRLWEAGVRYRIARARGVWRAFRGGTLYAFGPELSRHPDGGSGVALLLEAPPGARPAEPADLLWIGPGPDGVHDTDDDRYFAVLYAAASPCADGIDNDDDGRTDFPRDRSCRSRSDDGEAP